MCTFLKCSRSVLMVSVLLLMVTGLAFAIDNPDQSNLAGTGGYVDLVATVTQVSGALHPFKYEYTFTFTEWYTNLEVFTIGNPSKISYWNAGNSQSTYFGNPTYNSRSTSVKWQLLNPNILCPADLGPISVWYYADVGNLQYVSASVGGADGVVASADPSDFTIGMALPEPGSLAAMGFGLLCFGSTFIRLKRR